MSEARSFEEILEEDGVLVYTCKGFSMSPMLRQHQDLVVIRKPQREYRKYDVVLFKQNNKYILHRIIKVTEDGYITAGDHNTFKDKPIKKEQVLGLLTAFVRDGKEIPADNPEYRIYSHLTADLYPLKTAYLKTRARASRLKKKLIK